MALNLTSLAGKTQTIDVKFMGQTCKVTFDPTVLTAANLTKAQNGEEDEFVEFFTACVKSWDVTKGTKKVPLTQKALQEVPLVLLRAIFMAIMADAGADVDEQGKASSGS